MANRIKTIGKGHRTDEEVKISKDEDILYNNKNMDKDIIEFVGFWGNKEYIMINSKSESKIYKISYEELSHNDLYESWNYIKNHYSTEGSENIERLIIDSKINDLIYKKDF